MTFTDLPTWLLSQADQHAHGLLTRRLADVGARGYEFRILQVLGADAPLSQVAIGSLARLDRRDVAVTLSALEHGGFVVRSPDPDDSRRNVVELTEPGRSRLIELEGVVARVQDDLLATLDEAERALLLDALRKIVR